MLLSYPAIKLQSVQSIGARVVDGTHLYAEAFILLAIVRLLQLSASRWHDRGGSKQSGSRLSRSLAHDHPYDDAM